MQVEQKKCSHCFTIVGFKGILKQIQQIKSSGTLSFTGTGTAMDAVAVVDVEVFTAVIVKDKVFVWSLRCVATERK